MSIPLLLQVGICGSLPHNRRIGVWVPIFLLDVQFLGAVTALRGTGR